MGMTEEGYVVLGSYTEETRAWDGVQRPKVAQGHYVFEVAEVTQEVSAGAKTNGAPMYAHTMTVVEGWDVETEKAVPTDEVGKQLSQRYIDAPQTIGRYIHFLNVVDNPPDAERGLYPSASVGKRFIGEVVHSSQEQDDPTAPNGRRTVTFANLQNERLLPAPPKAAQAPAAQKGKAPSTPPPAQNSKGGKSGGASARR